MSNNKYLSRAIREAALAPGLSREDRINYVLHILTKYEIKIMISELDIDDAKILKGVLDG